MSNVYSIALAFVLFPTICLGQEIPPKIQQYIEQAKSQGPTYAEQLKNSIAAGKQQLSEVRGQRISQKEKREKIANVKDKIEQLESLLHQLKDGTLLPIPTIDPFQLAVGQIGRLHGGNSTEWEIISVIDGSTVLVLPSRTITKIDFVGVEARQRFEKQYGQALMLRGNETSGLVDGQKVVPSGVFEVTETERYGNRTVFALQLFDVSQVEKFLPKKESEKVSKKPEADNRGFRRWTDATGKYDVIARYLSIDGDKVVLEKRDGKTSTLPIERLSKQDQAWLEEKNNDQS